MRGGQYGEGRGGVRRQRTHRQQEKEYRERTREVETAGGTKERGWGEERQDEARQGVKEEVEERPSLQRGRSGEGRGGEEGRRVIEKETGRGGRGREAF